METLSNREREVLLHMAKGLNNKQISAKLRISEKTVKNHVSHIYQKLHVKNRVQAVIAVYRYTDGLPDKVISCL
jgi:DNA-binding NarL/FixJ family response regulator